MSPGCPQAASSFQNWYFGGARSALRLDRHAKYFLMDDAYERAATIGFRCAYDRVPESGGLGGISGAAALFLIGVAFLVIGNVVARRWKEKATRRRRAAGGPDGPMRELEEDNEL